MMPVMFERFSDEARRTVVRALVEARRLGHDYVGTEHALVALVPARGAAANALASEGVTLDRARLAVADVVGRGRGVSPWDDGPYTARVRHAFELCKREAYEFGHRYIANGHLLLALLQIGDANAVRVLGHMGVDLETLRQKVEDSIGTERPPVAPTERRTHLGRRPTIVGNAGVDADDVDEGDAYDTIDVVDDSYELNDSIVGLPATPAPPSSTNATAAATHQPAAPQPQRQPAPPVPERHCSFCTRTVDDRDSYVAGAEALICADCVRAAVRLIGDEDGDGPDDEAGPEVEGPVPDDDPTAVTAVIRAFTTVFDRDAPEADRAALLEDGELLAPLLDWAVERYPGTRGAEVDRIRFLGTDRALVRYSILLGQARLPQSGWAHRPGPTTPWRVTRTSYTTLLHQAGIPTP